MTLSSASPSWRRSLRSPGERRDFGSLGLETWQPPVGHRRRVCLLRRRSRKRWRLSTCDREQRRVRAADKCPAATFGDSVPPLGTESPSFAAGLRRDE
jgi:hypothetical protein